MKPKVFHLVTFDLFLVSGILLYSNTSSIPLYLDDAGVLGASRYVDLPELLGRAWSFGRWLVELTFAYSDYIKTILPSFSLHRAVSILIHILTSFEVYLIAFLLISQAPNPKLKTQNSKLITLVAFLAGFLFLIHPLQTSTVNYLAQRYVLMAAFFLFAAFLCYLLARVQNHNLLLYAACGVFFIFGLYCKQFVLVFPGLIFLAEWLVFGRTTVQLKRALLVTLLLILFSTLYLQFYVGMNLLALAVSEAPHPPLHYLMTEAWVLVKYVQMLLAPFSLALHHDLTVIENAFNPRFWAGLALVAGLLAAAWRARKEAPLVTFSILWYLILLAESSSVVPRIDFIYDYRTYPANLGLFFILALVVGYASAKWKKLVVMAVPLLVAMYAYLAYAQNRLWTDPPAFYRKELGLYPESSKSWNLLGRELILREELDRAEEAFSESLRYMDQTNVLFRPVLSSLDYYYLGMIEEKRGNAEAALERLQQAVLYSFPRTEARLDVEYLDPTVYLQLAKLYHQTGNSRMWKFVVRQALFLFPGQPVVWREYKKVLEEAGSTASLSPAMVGDLMENLLRWRPEITAGTEKGVRIVLVAWLVGLPLLFLLVHYLILRESFVRG